jgi:hypothetical protein
MFKYERLNKLSMLKTKSLTIILLFLLLLVLISFFGYTRLTGFATYQKGSVIMNATVGAWVAINPSSSVISGILFGSLNPNTNNNMAENDTTSDDYTNCTDYNITIDTSSNTNVDLYNKAEGDLNLIGDGVFIKIENVTLGSNQTADGNNVNMTATTDGTIPLNTTWLIIGSITTNSGPCYNVNEGDNCYIAYWLDVPSIIPGTYNTSYYYCGVQNGQGSAQCG